MKATSALGWGWRLSTKPMTAGAAARQLVQTGVATAFLWSRSPSQVMTLAAVGALTVLPRAALAAGRSSIDPTTPLTSTPVSYAARFWLVVGQAQGQIVRPQAGFVIALLTCAVLGRSSAVVAVLFPAGLVLFTLSGCAMGVVVVRTWFANRVSGAVGVLAFVCLVAGVLVSLPLGLGVLLLGIYGATVSVAVARPAGRWVAEVGVLSAEDGQGRWEPAPMRRVVAVLARSKSLAAALLWKGSVSRWRAPTTPLRLVAVFAIAAAYGIAARSGVDFFLLDDLGALGVILAAGLIIDGAPSPLGSEGARLILFMTAPISRSRLMSAKTVSHLVPCVVISLSAITVAAAVGGRLGDLPVSAIGVTLFALVIVGVATLISAFDTNINAYPSSPMEAVWLEEIPGTPARAAAFQLIVGLTVGAVLLLTGGP